MKEARDANNYRNKTLPFYAGYTYICCWGGIFVVRENVGEIAFVSFKTVSASLTDQGRCKVVANDFERPYDNFTDVSRSKKSRNYEIEKFFFFLTLHFYGVNLFCYGRAEMAKIVRRLVRLY